MGDSTVLTQDIPLSSGEPVRADAVPLYSAPTCCGQSMVVLYTKRKGAYRRYICKGCEKRESIGALKRGRKKKIQAGV
jgi:hypothetical protein